MLFVQLLNVLNEAAAKPRRLFHQHQCFCFRCFKIQAVPDEPAKMLWESASSAPQSRAFLKLPALTGPPTHVFSYGLHSEADFFLQGQLSLFL